jgi:hypothetical protein
MEAKVLPGARKYHALLWKDGHPIEVHHMTMEPTAEQSRYRAVSSMNWFNEREVKIFAERKPHRFHANIKCDSDWEMDMRFERRAYAPDPSLSDTLPQFTHASIWDFYKAIGYDYKAKRYTRTDA